MTEPNSGNEELPASGEPGTGSHTDDVPAAPPPPAAAAPDPGAPPPSLPPPPPPPGAALPPPPGPGFTQQPPGAFTPQPGAPVAWAAPAAEVAGLAVPGALGLRFGSTLGRFLAWCIDWILIVIAAALILGVIGVAAPSSRSSSALLTTVISLGASFLYFVGLWTSSGRATLGMRLMKLQVGTAFDGRTPTIEQATLRWVALGIPFQAFTLVPALSGAVGGLLLLWYLALLISTVTSPTRQGLHDRIANSAIVQPVGASTPATACLILLILLLILPIIAIVALIGLGSQMPAILSSVGTSVYP